MKKNPLFLIFSLVALSLSTISCDKKDEPDGSWSAMKWNVDNINGKVKYQEESNALMEVTVSGEGSFDLICKNYSHFWISDVNYPMNSESYLEYEYEWLKITIADDIAFCEFSDVADDFHKELLISFTAGDIFYTVSFNREEDFGESGKWAPMKWSLENVKGDVDMEYKTYFTNFYVDGNCSFDIVCTNYADIWLLPSLYTPYPLEDFYNVDALWCHLSIKGNVISCNLDKWDGNDIPGIDFKITAGEIYDNLYFYQKTRVKPQ